MNIRNLAPWILVPVTLLAGPLQDETLPVPDAPADARQAPEALFSPALLAHFRSEFVRGWESEREAPVGDEELRAGQDEFERIVRGLPRELGRNAAREAEARDAAQAALDEGDGVALVQRVAAGDLEIEPARLDEAFLDAVFAPRASSGVVDGGVLPEAWSASEPPPLPAGTTIEFGAGFHELNRDHALFGSHDPFPEDLTIRGVGMNATLVTLGELSSNTPVQRLRVQDLTLDCGNNYLFDLRRGELTIDLERVRIVRFDMGAGGSLVFSVNHGSLVRARDCEILGGFGESPGSGNLMRGAAFVALFSRCTFAHLDLNVDRTFPGTAVFRDCVFEGMAEDPTLDSHATFERCVVRPLVDSRAYRRASTRSLTELFPAWQER